MNFKLTTRGQRILKIHLNIIQTYETFKKRLIAKLHTIIVTLLMACNFAQAKTVIEKPFFDGRNNRRLENEKVTLDTKATYLDIRIYSRGNAGIASQAALYIDGTAYKYLGSPQLPKDEMIKVPECGYISATLKFKPLPAGTVTFDFKEMPTTLVGTSTAYDSMENDQT